MSHHYRQQTAKITLLGADMVGGIPRHPRGKTPSLLECKYYVEKDVPRYSVDTRKEIFGTTCLKTN